MTSKNIGTCPACFQFVTLSTKGTITRHGWTVNGNRQVGHYYQTWHSGPCFGTGYLPFEVSATGTVDFFWKIIVPSGKHILASITHLATKPALVVEANSQDSYREKGWGARSVSPVYSVMLLNGDEGVTGEKHHYATKFSYSKTHTARTLEAANAYANITSDAEKLCDAVATWKLAPVFEKKVAAKPVKPIHYARTGLRTLCGVAHTTMNGRVMAPSTHNHDLVTCEACKAKR